MSSFWPSTGPFSCMSVWGVFEPPWLPCKTYGNFRTFIVTTRASVDVTAVITFGQKLTGQVGEGRRVVVAVGVAVHLLRIGYVHDRVHGQEPAQDGVVLAGTEVGQTGGGVAGAAQEATVARP